MQLHAPSPKRTAKRRVKRTEEHAFVNNKENNNTNGGDAQQEEPQVPLVEADRLWMLARRQCAPSFRRKLVGLETQFEYSHT